MRKIKLGLVGIGKIARDQHLPVLAASPDFELVATASRNASVDGVRGYRTIGEMLDSEPGLEAVSLCAPPGPRDEDARLALARGLDVLIEKPPAASVGAARDLERHAQTGVLVASWHSRHAPAVDLARAWLTGKRLLSAEISWREDIRKWHPGQDWILEPRGMGVFDPGINALSILTHIVDEPIVVERAELGVASNRQAPLTADLLLRSATGAPIEAVFDFLQTGVETWTIRFVSEAGELILRDGGAKLAINGVEQTLGALPRHEYEGVYRNFAARVRERRSDCDLSPLELVADVLMLARRRPLPAFSF